MFSANCERKNSESLQTSRSRDQKTRTRKAPRVEGALERIQADAPFDFRSHSKALRADRPILCSSDPVGLGAAWWSEGSTVVACIVFCGHRRGSFQRPLQYTVSIR